jgi:Na+/pantothenate symporter
MIENIIASIISGLILTFLLELLKGKNGASTKTFSPDAAKPPSPITETMTANVGSKRDSIPKIIIRVLMSVIAGFFLSAMAAGIIESEVHSEIEFGSSLMVFLMIAATFVAWMAFSRIGPLRSKN